MDIIGFKTKIEPLVSITEGYAKVWQGDLFTSVAVLIQNLCFDGRDCHGYDKDKEVDKIKSIISLLREIATYQEHHTITWIVENIEMAWMGYTYED